MLCRSHPVWPSVSVIPHLDHSCVARVLAYVRDPRFFVDSGSPDRLSKMKKYLGLTPFHQKEAKYGATEEVHVRLLTTVGCWRGQDPTKEDLQKESYFLWRMLGRIDCPERAYLRVTQKWIAFLRHVWMDVLNKRMGPDKMLFVPEHFFSPAGAMWFRHATGLPSR